MVHLTITPTISDAIGVYRNHHEDDQFPMSELQAMGKPIHHGQVVELWKGLKAKCETKYTLEDLLRGSKVYVPPPAPKPEPVSLGARVDSSFIKSDISPL